MGYQFRVHTDLSNPCGFFGDDVCYRNGSDSSNPCLNAIKAIWSWWYLLLSLPGTLLSCQLRTIAVSFSRRRWLSISLKFWETNWTCLLCTAMILPSFLHQQVLKEKYLLRWKPASLVPSLFLFVMIMISARLSLKQFYKKQSSGTWHLRF